MASSVPAASAILLLLLLLFFLAAPAGGNIILPACKTVSGRVDPAFCEEALGSVGAGVDAKSYKELAAVAADLLVANATSTKAKIDGLLTGGGGKNNGAAALQALRSCQALYGGIVDGGRRSAAAIKAGWFGVATAGLEKASAAAKRCEEGFGKSGVPSPLTKEGDDASRLAGLAVALLAFVY